MTAETKINVNKNIQSVFAVALTYPEFITFFFKKNRWVDDSLNLHVSVGMRKMGINFEWEGSGVANKPEAINFVQTNGLFKGLTADWIFSESSRDLTQVKILTHFKINFFMLSKPLEYIASRLLIENTTKKILIDLKNSCERSK